MEGRVMERDGRRRRGLAASNAVIRLVAVAALLSGLAYLAWRFTGLGTNPWLSIPLLILEVWGLAQLGLLTMLGWRGAPSERPESADEIDVDVIVTATFHSADELERSLIACNLLDGHRRILVVIRPDRQELIELAARFDVEVLQSQGNHIDLFRHGLTAIDSPIAAWFEAGQVPMRDFLRTTTGHFAEPQVAVVQARQGMLNKDSLATMRGGRDEAAYRAEVAFPAQGSRGYAPWTGGGSIVRSAAIDGIGDFDSTDQGALGRALVRLHAAGWRSRYQGERQLVLDTAPDSLESYLVIRRRRAIEALRVFASEENPLRYPGLHLRQRFDHVALASTYLNSVRQLGLTVVLLLSLVTGALPFGGDTKVWAALWLPMLALGIVGRNLLARGTMGVGDWTRQGWRTLAPDLSAIANVTGLSDRTVRFRGEKESGIRSLSRMRLVTGVLVALDVALIARGLTYFWPRMLPRFSAFERVMVLLIALIVMASIIDVLQVVVRRNQRRANYRLSTSLVGYIDGVRMRIVDLSASGLGARTKTGSGIDVGHAVDVSLGLPDDDDFEVVRGRGEVRSVSNHQNHDRIGIKFGDLDHESRARLIGYCAVGHHDRAGRDATIDLTPGHFDANRSHQRAVQALSGSAALLGLLALFAGPAAQPSLADVGVPVTACLDSSTAAPLPGGQFSFHYDGGWHEAGVGGDDGCLVATMSPNRTTVAVRYEGVRMEKVQDLAADPEVRFVTVAGSVVVESSGGVPLAGAEVELHRGGWGD
ncbi:MAG: PilZ domain-containing protein, partial [Acidimicrobiales bacterium]